MMSDTLPLAVLQSRRQQHPVSTGTIVDGELVELPVLAERLTAAAQAGATAPELHLRADRATRYERVTEVMALAQAAGVTRIAFVTDRPETGQAAPVQP